MAKRKPQRTCVGCKQVTTKRELVRVVRSPEGTVEIDATGKRAGRGAYLCANRGCWQRALAQKQLSRALKITLSKEDTDRLAAYGESLPDLDEDIQGGSEQ
ncbi:MAG: RNase P modulator RnpM [Anaerolineae bacterium]